MFKKMVQQAWDKVMNDPMNALGWLFFFGLIVVLDIFLLILLAWLAKDTLGSGTIDQYDLTGQQVLDTGQITCSEESDGALTWINESDDTYYITKAQVWMGMFKGSVSDFAVWVNREGDEGRYSVLLHSNWDHYTDPVAPDHYIQMDYSPHHIAVKPGERLALHSFCSNLEDSNAVGHATLTIWYYQ